MPPGSRGRGAAGSIRGAARRRRGGGSGDGVRFGGPDAVPEGRGVNGGAGAVGGAPAREAGGPLAGDVDLVSGAVPCSALEPHVFSFRAADHPLRVSSRAFCTEAGLSSACQAGANDP